MLLLISSSRTPSMAKANDIQKKAGQEIAECKYMLFWFLCWIDFFKVYLWVGNIGPKNKKVLTSCDESPFII
jgi:hypothetical protein